MNLFLTPFSWLWTFIYRVRRFCYKYGAFEQKKYLVPIVSVGNLTFGGTGKTPFTVWISNYLGSKNKKIVVLTRGYRGKLEKSHGIIRSGRRMGVNPVEFGDEALLLSRRLKNASIVVGRNRAANLEYYFDSEKPDVVVLDDGYQHLKLQRNLNIVLFDATMPMERYKVAPKGYMREGFQSLKDAQIAVIGRVDQVTAEKVSELEKIIRHHGPKELPIIHFSYGPTSIYDFQYRPKLTPEELKGAKAIAVSGIASPESFYQLLSNLGVEIKAQLTYPDHYHYRQSDIDHILKTAREQEAMVITTEKDMVKLRRLTNDQIFHYLEIDIKITKGEIALKQKLEKILELT